MVRFFVEGLAMAAKGTKACFNPKLVVRARRGAKAVEQTYQKTLRTVQAKGNGVTAIYQQQGHVPHAGQVSNLVNGKRTTTTVFAGEGNPMLRVTSRGGNDIATYYRYGVPQMRVSGQETNTLVGNLFANNNCASQGRLLAGTSTKFYVC